MPSRSAGESGAPALRRLPSSRTLLLALLPLLFAAIVFLVRAGRPIEQGGDAFSDARAALAGKNFVDLGFLPLHFLPVEIARPTRPIPVKEEIYTHYPPGSELLNGLYRRLGIDDLRDWRLIAAAASLLGLVFWFLGLRVLFDDTVALLGLATYALNFTFIWLGDSVHHYAYSDCLRSLVFWLAARVARPGHRPRETVALAITLFAQSLLAFDYILYSQILVFGLGASGWRGEARRRLVLLAAMPVVGVGLHLLQNVWTLGLSGTVADFGEAFTVRALSQGSGQYMHASFATTLDSLIHDSRDLMGFGIGTILVCAAIGVAAWARSTESRDTAARALGTVALGTSAWYVLMHQHAAEHTYVTCHLLPLASLSLALALRGVFLLAAEHSRRLAWTAALVLAAGLAAEGSVAYQNDSDQRTYVSRLFIPAYRFGNRLPDEGVIATNIIDPAPPALSVMLDRRFRTVRSVAEAVTAYGHGTTVIFLFGAASPIADDLYALLRKSRAIAKDESGGVVEVKIE
jgi:hypothetical protein